MITATVSELPRDLEVVTKDPFIDTLTAPSGPRAPAIAAKAPPSLARPTAGMPLTSDGAAVAT